MRKCIKAFANVIAANLGMKLWIWQNSQSWRKQVFMTYEICLSIDISGWKIMPRVFVDSLGETVYKLRIMLIGTLIFFMWCEERRAAMTRSFNFDKKDKFEIGR